MRIQIASDLHRELLRPEQRNPGHRKYKPIIEVDKSADVLVLAGDIDNGYKSVKWMEGLGVPVIYIAGNHEYWNGLPTTNLDIFKHTRGCKNVKFLDGDTAKIGDTTFVGGTMWTDFDLDGEQFYAMQMASRIMTDYRRTPGLSAESVLAEHRRYRKAFDEALDINDKIVAVSHHLPHRKAINQKWADSRHTLANQYYASDLTDLLRKGPALWIHGHTHESMDSVIEGVRVVCNPYGYSEYETNEDFNPSLVIEV